jgi:hypothetical protein
VYTGISVDKDVFISYAKGDREWAEQVCAQLEEAGIGCWIAPRDIAPGVTWPAAITDAIRQCRAMIVVFSQHANESRQMAREVEVADSRHVPILPVRVEEIEPAGDMEYFLGNRQWFDLHGGKVERRRALPDAIASLLGQLELTGAVGGAVAPAAPPPAKAAPAKAGLPKWLPVAVALTVVAGGVAMYSLRPKTSGVPAATVNPAPVNPAPATPDPAPVNPAPAATVPSPAKPRPAKTAAAVVPPQPAPQKTAGAFAGKWQAEVKYGWGAVHNETFQFKVDENEVMGSASYVRTPRGILDGKIDGNRISFLTKSQTMLGSQTYEEKHLYKGRLNGDSIEFVLQTESGYDARSPEMFTARRVE